MLGKFTAVMKRPVLAAGSGIGMGGTLAILASQTSPLIAAGIFFGAAAAAVIFAWPFFGFLLTSFVIPLERIGRFTNDSAAATISLMRIVGTLTLAGLLFQKIFRKAGLWLPAPLWLYSCYLLVLTASVFQQDASAIEGIRGVSATLANMVFFLLTVNIVQSREHAKKAIIAWLLSTMAIGIFTVAQYHAGAAVTENRQAATGMRTTDERFSTVLYDSTEYELLGNNIKRAIGPTSSAAVYGVNLILAL